MYLTKKAKVPLNIREILVEDMANSARKTPELRCDLHGSRERRSNIYSSC